MLYLAPKIFFAPVRDKGVILDLARDKYVALNANLAHALVELTRPASPPRSETLSAARASLLAQGFLSETPPGAEALGQSAPPAREARWPSRQSGISSGLSAASFCAVMWALLQTQMLLKSRPFHQMVSRLAREPVRHRPAGRGKSEQQVLDEFHIARPWFPIKPICRLDAPALCLHLRRNGHPAQLIFGVTLERFAAHCWVQCEDRVMREPQETIAGYATILVV